MWCCGSRAVAKFSPTVDLTRLQDQYDSNMDGPEVVKYKWRPTYKVAAHQLIIVNTSTIGSDHQIIVCYLIIVNT